MVKGYKEEVEPRETEILQPQVLHGKSWRYNLHNNTVEPLDKKLVLYFEKIPTEKESEGLACL